MNEAVKKVRSLAGIIQKKELNLNIGINDILYAVVCYIMSACEVFGGRTPFSLSAYAAAFSRDKWGAFIVVAALGLIRFRMDFSSFTYIISMVLATLFMGMIKSKERFRAFCMGISLFSVLLCSNIASGFMWESFFGDAAEAALCCGGAMVFSSAVALLVNAGERKCIFDTEIVNLLIFFALIVRCTVSLPLVLGMDISVICAVVLLLIINLEGELASGATMGIVFGIAVCGGASGVTSSVGSFAFASLCSGMLKRFGKWGVVLGFVIANTAMIAFFSGEVFPFDIFEIVFASVIFALLPRRVTSYISSFGAKTVHSVKDAYLSHEKIQTVISERLERLSSSFKSLALSYDKCFENKNMSKNYIIHMLDTASAKICPGCGLKYNCWERGYKESYKAMLRMLEIAEDKGEITEVDVPDVLKQKCIKLEDFVASFNRMYEVYKVEKLWQQRLNESRMLVSSQLDGVSRSVKKLSEEFDMCLDVAAEKELKTKLDIYGIDFSDVTFLKSREDSFLAEITLKTSRISPKDESIILDAIKEVTYTNVSKTSVRYEAGGTVMTCKPSAKYVVSTGSSSAVRRGEKVSGDSFILCENSYGEFVAAISDGMGTGIKASVESVNATELLKNFMVAGMDVETSLELINSALLLRSSGDNFATMDVCITNLDDGTVIFSKSGAAPGYIKNECGVSTVYSDSLPFGVLSDYGKINTEVYTLENSAIVVMVSDGISDIFQLNGQDMLKKIIEDTDTSNPQILASLIMKEAMEICDKKAEDDMTVLVLSIKKQ